MNNELTDEWTTIGEVTNWDNNKTLLCKRVKFIMLNQIQMI